MGDKDTSTENAGASSIPEPIQSGELVSTTEFIETDEPETPPEGEGAAGEAGKKVASDADKTKLDLTFQDSPRFQELQEEKRRNLERAIKAEAKAEALEKSQKDLLAARTPATPPREPPKFVDVFKMKNEDIIDAIEKDAKGFLGNFAQQIRTTVLQDVGNHAKVTQERQAKSAQDKSVEELYAKYEKDNPDFVEMWEKGELQKYMQENPGHTPISAHKLLKLEKDKEEAVAKARKEEAEKLRKDAKRGRRTIVVGGGNQYTPHTGESTEDLKNTSKFGGLTRVLTERSLARSKG